MRPALAEVAALLACPECGLSLEADDRALRCGRGHSFDVAKQGYVSLLTGASTKMTGDTADMLDARAAFQGAGHFAPVARAVVAAAGSRISVADTASAEVTAAGTGARVVAGTVVENGTVVEDGPAGEIGTAGGIDTSSGTNATSGTGTASENAAASGIGAAGENAAAGEIGTAGENAGIGSRQAGAVLEIGAGTGYYLAHLLDAAPEAIGIALDVAKPAARRCARAHPRAAAVLADAWRGLPVGDARLDTVLAVFAPRNPTEVARVLRADGRFVVATPTSRHLAELIGPLDMVTVDPDKDRRLDAAMTGHFVRTDRTVVEYPMTLSHSDIAHVVGMGPSAFHAGNRTPHGIDALPESLEVTASVVVSTYRPTRCRELPEG